MQHWRQLRLNTNHRIFIKANTLIRQARHMTIISFSFFLLLNFLWGCCVCVWHSFSLQPHTHSEWVSGCLLGWIDINILETDSRRESTFIHFSDAYKFLMWKHTNFITIYNIYFFCLHVKCIYHFIHGWWAASRQYPLHKSIELRMFTK